MMTLLLTLYFLLGSVYAFRLYKQSERYEHTPLGEAIVIGGFVAVTWPLWVGLELWQNWRP